ncbi:MAG: ATP-binding cassette domain-containing protein, partial [Tannerellaceae bacterium]
FQSPMLINQLNPVQNIMLTLANIYPKQQAQKIAIDILQTVGLGNHLDAAVTHLSYGQQQRVAIARALSFPAEVVLMDEPFKGLQPSLTNQLIDLTLELQRKHNFVFLFITHHMREVEYMQAETICLNEVI